MRAIVIALVLAAGPIYLGQMLLGDSSNFAIGAFFGAAAVQYESEASDAAHDALDQARAYAATHPDLVAGLKAHRQELQVARDRRCAAVKC